MKFIKLVIALALFIPLQVFALADASAPTKIQIPFGNSAGGAYIRTIPVTSQIGIQNGAASYTDGFPPLNFVPVGAGGVPPFGQDMNGILNSVSSHARWWAAGGPVFYDSAYQTAIGGYPAGACVQSLTTVAKLWCSTVDNNASNPDTGGANWQYPNNAINATNIVGSGTISATATGGAGLSVANATNATNLSGGLGGSIPYQSAVNTTVQLANGTAGQALLSNGTTLAPSWGAPPGALLRLTKVLASNAAWAKLAATNTIVVTGVGGGGGGGAGGGATATGNSGTGGGGGNAAIPLTLPIVITAPAATYPIVIGVGGVGGAGHLAANGDAGGSGSNTTFNGLILSYGVTGGAGGIVNGNAGIVGAAGKAGAALLPNLGGAGGAGGNPGPGNGIPGAANTATGGGGGGGGGNNNTSGGLGGAGGSGYVLIWEYK